MSFLAGAPTSPQPTVVLDTFIASLHERDLDHAAASFTRRACLLTPGGTAVHGRDDIALILAQLIEAAVEIGVGQVVTHHAGDVAHLSAEWTMLSRGPGGSSTTLHTSPTAVLRWLEGTWKIAFLAPWETQ